ncbi:MAG: peptide ABC transporter substrate-binding protein [Candidatus Sumerlaeota bacterium]
MLTRFFFKPQSWFRILLIMLSLASLISCGGSDKSAFDADNKILLLGNGAEPQYMDPHLITGSPGFMIMRSLFEGLVELHPESLEPVGGVAESWDISDDGKTYTFHFRSSAKWSNGEALTADDFLYSWNRVLSPGLGSQYAYMLHCIKNAEAFNNGDIKDFSQVGLKAPDAQTFVVELESPTPYFLQLLNMPCFYPVNRENIEAFGAMDERTTKWNRVGNMVSNGAFVLSQWEPDRLIEVRRNPYYWDADAVKLDGVRFLPINNLQTEERMFQTGEIHITQSLAPSKVVRYKKEKDPRLEIHPYLGTYYYKINTTKPPLDNPKVRRALAMTIDRASITNDILKAGQTPATALTPPDTAGYTSRAAIPYDPEKARELLAEAGYANGKGLPPIELLYNTQEAHRQIAEAVQAMWKNELGVEVHLANQDWKVFLSRLSNLDYAIARSSWIGDYLDPTTFLDIFRSDSGNNRTGFASDEYDRLLDEAARLRDEDKRYALYQQAEKILLDAAPVMPVYAYSRVYLKAPEVKAWATNALNIQSFKAIDLVQVPVETP